MSNKSKRLKVVEMQQPKRTPRAVKGATIEELGRLTQPHARELRSLKRAA